VDSPPQVAPCVRGAGRRRRPRRGVAVPPPPATRRRLLASGGVARRRARGLSRRTGDLRPPHRFPGRGRHARGGRPRLPPGRTAGVAGRRRRLRRVRRRLSVPGPVPDGRAGYHARRRRAVPPLRADEGACARTLAPARGLLVRRRTAPVLLRLATPGDEHLGADRDAAPGRVQPRGRRLLRRPRRLGLRAGGSGRARRGPLLPPRGNPRGVFRRRRGRSHDRRAPRLRPPPRGHRRTVRPRCLRGHPTHALRGGRRDTEQPRRVVLVLHPLCRPRDHPGVPAVLVYQGRPPRPHALDGLCRRRGGAGLQLLPPASRAAGPPARGPPRRAWRGRRRLRLHEHVVAPDRGRTGVAGRRGRRRTPDDASPRRRR